MKVNNRLIEFEIRRSEDPKNWDNYCDGLSENDNSNLPNMANMHLSTRPETTTTSTPRPEDICEEVIRNGGFGEVFKGH